jgi:hypothetical protein
MNINSVGSKANQFYAAFAEARATRSTRITAESDTGSSAACNVSISNTSKLLCSADWLSDEDAAKIGKMLDFAEKNGMDTKGIDELSIKIAGDRAMAYYSGYQMPTLSKGYLMNLLKEIKGPMNTAGSDLSSLDESLIAKLVNNYDQFA